MANAPLMEGDKILHRDYLTIIPRARVGYDVSSKRECNNRVIKNIQRSTSKSATIIAKKTRTPNILEVNGIWAHIPLPINQSKFRIRNIP